VFVAGNAFVYVMLLSLLRVSPEAIIDTKLANQNFAYKFPFELQFTTPELQTSDYSVRHSHLDTNGLSVNIPKHFTLLALGCHICK